MGHLNWRVAISNLYLVLPVTFHAPLLVPSILASIKRFASSFFNPEESYFAVV